MAVRVHDRTPAQGFAFAFGVAYLAVGILGFALTGWDRFFGDTGEKLVIFELNPFHNVVHLLLGGVWLVASDDHYRARTVNLAFGAAYALVGLLGVFGLLDSILSTNSADHGLHFVSAALALYFGTFGAEFPQMAQEDI
ncbi:MAG: DUF4383 domain-containing protein [Actinobacteria bacterium]|nr:DUF4383 domain-containing protein [Actinomycetota bacterium]